MWLKRLLKISGTGQDGGAGSGSGGSIPVFEGQGGFFGGGVDPPTRREVQRRDNANNRRKKRKMLERKREWRSLRDQQ